MIKFLIFLAIVFFTSCKTTTYYISRHGEKVATGSPNDPPLSATGEQQAQDLKVYLQGKSIKGIYSTNFIRTRSTAQPASVFFNLPVQVYSQVNRLVDSLKGANSKNILIVGHSNTVDDIVNRFTGAATLSDLADNEYGNLFIIKKKGSGYAFERVRVSQP